MIKISWCFNWVENSNLNKSPMIMKFLDSMGQKEFKVEPILCAQKLHAPKPDFMPPFLSFLWCKKDVIPLISM